MYIRTVRAKGKEYVQLAHNTWDPRRRASKTQVLYNFGRKDQLDVDALRRLVQSISRYLDPDEAQQVREEWGLGEAFDYLGARQFGGSWLLDGLWRRLELDRVLKGLGRERGFQTPVERLIFAMVANRALAPVSKLGVEHWVNHEAHIDGLPKVEVHQLYRAMDFLLENAEELQREIFFSVATLLNLEVDLIFLDTTTAYFEIEAEDADAEELEALRKRGYSKDHHPELAQVVIGFAVTREGIPVRSWVWPGNTADQAVVEEVKRDLNGWQLGRVVWVADTGFNSERSRRILRGAGGHWILGEKLRVGSKGLPTEAPGRGGKYRRSQTAWRSKRSWSGPKAPFSAATWWCGTRRKPGGTGRNGKKILEDTERRLAEPDQLQGEPHHKAACALRSHKTYGRYLRQTKIGLLRLDKGKIRSEEHFDGKFLVGTSDECGSSNLFP